MKDTIARIQKEIERIERELALKMSIIKTPYDDEAPEAFGLEGELRGLRFALSVIETNEDDELNIRGICAERYKTFVKKVGE